MKYSVKSIAMGAMCIALNLTGVIVDRMLGGLSELVMLLILALPICLYTIHYSTKEGIGVYFATAIACLFFSTPTMLIYALIANLLGLWYGIGVRKQFQHGTLFGVNVIVMGICYVFTTITFAKFFGYDIDAELQVFETTLHSMHIYMTSTQLWTIYIYATLWLSILQSASLHLVVFMMLKRFRIEHQQMQPILDWRLPKMLASVFLFVLVVYFAGNMLQCSYIAHPVMVMCCLSAQLVCSLFGAIVSLIMIPMRQKRLLLILLMVALLLPITKEILMGIGLFDAWFDIRKKLR